MTTKVFFIGNVLGGDDGIGPRMYTELSHNSKLKHIHDIELSELGVLGFNMLSYVEDSDRVVIVDAVASGESSSSALGDVFLLREDELEPETNLISLHDFGVEKTAYFLRSCYPNIKSINVIGIKVLKTQPFSEKLSPELEALVPTMKEKIINYIIQLHEDKI